MLCPLCGVQLVGESAVAVAPTAPLDDDTPDGPSFVRRLAFGAITLLGLYQGVKHLALAGVLSQTGLPALSSLGHLSLLIVSTLAASIVAGTVNRRAEATGLLLALAGAIAFLAPDVLHGVRLPEEWLIGVPVLLVLIGVVGGFAGRLVMPPAPMLPTFGRLETHVVVRVERKRVRVAWFQVLLGIGVAVAGAVYADAVRHALAGVFVGGGSSYGARPMIAWQISSLAAMLGGIVAGSHARAEFRQSLYAGLGAAAVVPGVLLVQASGSASPLPAFWMDQFDVTAGAIPYVLIAVNTAVATGLGGWLGSQALPSGKRR